MRRLGLVTLVLGGLVGLGGCASNPARDAALARAKSAHDRGDLVGEALALRDACGFAKDDKDLCKRADAAWQAAQGASEQAAKLACKTVDSQTSVDACLGAVGELRRLSPTDPEAAQLVEPAAKQQAEHCLAEAPKWRVSIEDGLELIRCEDSRAAQIGLASYSQNLHGIRVSTRDLVLQLLSKPGFAAKRGATSELLATAQCLAPSTDVVDQARGARAIFVEQARAFLDLRAATNQPLPELCGVVAGALGDRAGCGVQRDGAPAITIAGDIAIAPVEHSATETQESVDYVAGIIHYPNPDYQPAVNAESQARAAKDSADSQYRRDKSDCDSATSTANSQSNCSSSDCSARATANQMCSRASTSESMFREKESEYDSAHSRLQSTPSELEKKDIRTAHYMIRHHSWRAAWRAKLRNDGQSIPAGGDTVAQDDETSGAQVAGVPADPLTPPGDRWYVAAIRDQVAAKMVEIVDAALRRRASDAQAGACSGELAYTPEWLECWARARLWSGGGAKPDALLAAITQGMDAKRGSAWPAIRCE